jgi:hypothetical protein
MQEAITVNNSTPDQAPETTTEQTSGIQQTRSGDGLGAPAQPATTSAADQQQLMNLLRSEAAGSVHDPSESSVTAGHVLIQLGIGVAAVVLIVAIAVFCQQQLNKFYHPAKPKRSTRRTKRVK